MQRAVFSCCLSSPLTFKIVLLPLLQVSWALRERIWWRPPVVSGCQSLHFHLLLVEASPKMTSHGTVLSQQSIIRKDSISSESKMRIRRQEFKQRCWEISLAWSVYQSAMDFSTSNINQENALQTHQTETISQLWISFQVALVCVKVTKTNQYISTS